MPIHFERTRQCLAQFDFHRLFVEELGWSNPGTRKTSDVAVKESRFTCRQIAELAGATVLEVESPEGNVSIVEVARRLRAALDVERVTKRFYGEFQEQQIAFLELIRGVPDERQRRWYASVLLNRLMFIYFLQKKYFIDGGDLNYMRR